MGVAYVSNERKITALAVGATMLLSLSLGGCATSLMDARAEAPAVPKASVYPPLEGLAPTRAVPAMTADERSKLAKELTAARDRQAPGGKARGGAAQAGPMNP